MMRVVGGALFKGNKILLVKRTKERIFWPGLWEIPGGRVEEGETDEEAILREFLEETKIKPRIVKQYFTFGYKYDGKDAVENDFLLEAGNF